MRKLLPALAALVALTAFAAATIAQDDKKKEKKPKPVNQQQGGNQARTPNQPANRNQQPSGSRSTGGNQSTRPKPLEQETLVIPPPGEQERAPANGEGSRANDPASTSPNNAAGQTASASSLFDPIVLGIAAMLLLAGFALHGLSFINTNRLKNDFGRISYNLNALHTRIEEISGQVIELRRRNQQPKAPDQENSDPDKFQRLEDRVRETRASLAETSQAIAAMANWAGEGAVERALGSSDELSDIERAQAIRIIERHLDPVSANAARLRSLAQEMDAFEERIRQRTWLPAEFSSRIRSLSQEIAQFEKWKDVAVSQLDSLRCGSMSERRRKFIEEKNRLAGSLNTGEISTTDYVKGCRRLTRELFSEAKGDKIPIAELEQKLAGLAVGASDLLMDWYDDLFQLAHAAAQSPIDSETAEELARIRRMAKDTLLKFDIQPEEIQPGTTSFDHRLHEAAVVTQSSRFPANTVIGVQQCGFRRVSNAEVLRRPKVIVARVGAG